MDIMSLLFEKYKWPTGFIGSALILAAMIGVFSYEHDKQADEFMSVAEIQAILGGSGGGSTGQELSTATESKDTSGSTNEGTSTSLDIDFSQMNLTTVSFTLIWTDDFGDNDEFRLDVEGPEDFSDSISGTSGSLPLNFDINKIENATDEGTTFGSGSWKVTVTAVNCPGLRPGPGTIPFDLDNGNTWDLKATGTYYFMPDEQPEE